MLTTKDRMASGNVTRRNSTARHPVPSPIPLHSVLQKPRRRVYGAGAATSTPSRDRASDRYIEPQPRPPTTTHPATTRPRTGTIIATRKTTENSP
ncbi:Uncharacterised protein [Mycobacteroides abscessus]|nr:Uncharacterised protein [Mycobacteroides abscessus]